MEEVSTRSQLVLAHMLINLYRAANATSHLFFAYMRSLSPESLGGVSGISQLPRSLQALLGQSEYPPEEPLLLCKTTARVVMIVGSVSPTPFALLRRAKHFEYRDDDPTLHQFSEYDDPVQSLTDECKRVLNRISASNQSVIPTNSNGTIPDGAWSRFEDIGFSSIADSLTSPGDLARARDQNGVRSAAAASADNLARPTTPSWADFLSSGFPDDRNNNPTLFPPDKQLPPLSPVPARGHSSQSHVREFNAPESLDPGELAAVHYFDLDETFWWVWMTSLAEEETPERKSVFGRCALIETKFHRNPWMIVEEQVKGASPGQDEGLYIAEKRSRFSFTKRSRLNRRKTTTAATKKNDLAEPFNRDKTSTPMSRIDPDREDRVRAAAKQIVDGKMAQEASRRGRFDDAAATKTNSVLTLQPVIASEAGPAMKWTSAYDKGTLKSAYLNDPKAGKGRAVDPSARTAATGNGVANGVASPKLERIVSDRELPMLPQEEQGSREEQPADRTPPRQFTPPQSTSTTAPKAQKPLPLTAFDEKPRIEDDVEHPAFRSQTEAEPSTAPVPEVQPDQRQKKGGLKKLFGRKKEESPRVVASASGADSYTSHKLQKQPPRDRFQPVQRPVVPEPIVDEEYQEPVQAAKHNSAALGALEGHSSLPERDEPTPEPQPEPVRARTPEHADGDQDYSRFNQGPLEDMPAFAPSHASGPVGDPSPDSDLEPQHYPEDDEEESRPQAVEAAIPVHEPEYATPPTSLAVQPQREEAPVEEPVEPAAEPVVASDRWAQIRKNAADRAQRMAEGQVGGNEAPASRKEEPVRRVEEPIRRKEPPARRPEQQTGRSRSQSGKTDDGETSGEETIESRVARIKARVAELTGNMDGPQNFSASRR